MKESEKFFGMINGTIKFILYLFLILIVLSILSVYPILFVFVIIGLLAWIFQKINPHLAV